MNLKILIFVTVTSIFACNSESEKQVQVTDQLQAHAAKAKPLESTGVKKSESKTGSAKKLEVKEIGWKDLRSFDIESRKFTDSKQKETVLNNIIRIPGYIAPFDEEGIEFMVVPYLQPCFHVPAPPPNQMIYVKLKEPSPVKFGAIWLEAKIQPAKTKKDLPPVGFEAVSPVRISKFE